MKRFLITFLFIMCSLFSFDVQSQQTVRFGLIYFYPPFVFSTKSGYIYGFDVDVAKAVCTQMNLRCTFTAYPLSSLFSVLKQNQVDAIMGAISVIPSREAVFDFTKPYYRSTMSYVTLNRSNIDVNNLQGKKIGVENESTFFEYVNKKFGKGVTLVAYNTNEELMTALSKKEIDLIVIDTPVANYWVKYSTGLFKTIGTPHYLPGDKGYGIATNKGNHQLLQILQQGLDTVITDGTLSKISQEYLKS